MITRSAISGLLLGITLGVSHPVAANGPGENIHWQFETSADKANKAVVMDMIQKRKNGYYAPPVYYTNIDRQYNCDLTATAKGNEGTNTNLANSPSTAGASSVAKGNDSVTSVGGAADGGVGSSQGSDVDGNQSNSGSVGSSVKGETTTTVNGKAWQALNSDQENSGNQTATVNGSNACNFGALN